MTQETAQPQQPIQPQYQFEEDTISLLDILLVLARQLKLIIVILILNRFPIRVSTKLSLTQKS